MINENELQGIKKTFSNHRHVKHTDSKSWLIRNPGGTEYWFRVTWCPSSLLLSGDVGEIVLTHYQAMSTWQEAAKWVLGADHGYLMQKSNKNRKFDQKETIKQIILIADEHLNEYNDDSIWYKLSELTSIPIANMKETKNIIDELELEHCGYFESHEDVYRFMNDDDDWTGSTSYDINTYYQYEALQVWAKAAIKEIK